MPLDNVLDHGVQAEKVVRPSGNRAFIGTNIASTRHAVGIQDGLLGAAARLDLLPRSAATQAADGSDLVSSIAARLRGHADTVAPFAEGRSGASLDWTSLDASLRESRDVLDGIATRASDTLAANPDLAMQAQMADLLR